MKNRVYFADFDVNLDNGELHRQGARVRLRGKPCQILITLLKNPGEIVTRQQLIEALWSANTFVDFDSNVKTALSSLRRVLGDSAEFPRFIETIQGVGYRFVHPVSRVDSPPAGDLAAREDAVDPALLPISSLSGGAAPRFLRVPDAMLGESAWRRIMAATALLLITAISIFVAMRNQHSVPNHVKYNRVVMVLPFENLSGDATTESLTDGITKEMTSSLESQLSGKIAVVGGNSALTYKHTHKTLDSISKELGGVDYVLEGTVRRSHDSVDIDAELFRVSDHKSVWTGSFERKLADVESSQQGIATHVLESISVEILQTRPPDLRTADPEDRQAIDCERGL